MPDSSSIRFATFRLDVGSRQLFNGAAEVRISPKAFDLLQALVEQRSRAMSKGELHDRLWPGTFVTEANLASLVAELRRALDDSPAEPRFIRTVHRFGYAFCGDVAEGSLSRAQEVACWVVWSGREIPLRDGENIIGRDPGAAVRLDFPSVSRRHARIVVSGPVVTVEDLRSKNGTFVGSTPADGVIPLNDFDELRVGSVTMTIRLLRGGESTQTVDR